MATKTVDIICQRCKPYSANKPFKIEHVPFVYEYVIQSMEFQSHSRTDDYHNPKPQWRYYSGMGSGNVFTDDNAYTTYEDAMKVAEQRANQEQMEHEKGLSKEELRRLEYVTLTTPDLEDKKLRDQLFDTQWNYDRMVDRVKELYEWKHRWPSATYENVLAIQRYVLDNENWNPGED